MSDRTRGPLRGLRRAARPPLHGQLRRARPASAVGHPLRWPQALATAWRWWSPSAGRARSWRCAAHERAGWPRRRRVPSARTYAAMAFDSTTGLTVMYGGSGGVGVTLSDIWTWDGSRWTATAKGPGRTPPAGPARWGGDRAQRSHSGRRALRVPFGPRHGEPVSADQAGPRGGVAGGPLSRAALLLVLPRGGAARRPRRPRGLAGYFPLKGSVPSARCTPANGLWACR